MSQNKVEALSSTLEKVHFSVIDMTDGKRYKVLFRPEDILRLKISKMRKTLSSVAQKPPFSFELCFNGVPLRDVEEKSCDSLGIMPQSVLLMRPVVDLQTAVPEISQEPVENQEASCNYDPTENPLRKTLSPHSASPQCRVRSSVTRTEDGSAVKDTVAPPVLCSSPIGGGEQSTAQSYAMGDETGFVAESSVGLSERQRVLQAELYEEAKRCQLFAPSSPEGGKEKPDVSVNESGNDTFIEEIIGWQKSPADDSKASPQLLVLQKQEKEVASPVSGNSGLLCIPTAAAQPELLSQGAKYYDMYAFDGPENKNGTYSSPHTPRRGRANISACDSNPSNLNMCLSTSDKKSNLKGKGALSLSTRPYDEAHSFCNSNKKNNVDQGTFPEVIPIFQSNGMHKCREEELAALVEDLQDDVNNLLALHVRNESVKRTLQKSLSDALERARVFEKDGQSARDQLHALMSLHTDPSSRAEGPSEVVSAEEIRAAAVNTAALREAELLRQGNVTLARQLAEETRRRREMSMVIEDMKGRIRVIVRVRPPMRFLSAAVDKSDTAPRAGDDDTRMLLDSARQTITLSNPVNGSARGFEFYRVCEESTSQEDVFSEIAPLVQLACDGVNISVLAYGQTGGGKTYTILGSEGQALASGRGAMCEKDEENGEEEEGDEECEEDGILQRTLRVLFRRLVADAGEEAARVTGTKMSPSATASHAESSASLFEVSCSLAELYNDHVYDLLAPPEILMQPFQFGGKNHINSSSNNSETRSAPKCDVKICKDGRAHVVGLTQHVVRDSREALRVFHDGAARRRVHATLQNSSSSRSHAIFTVHLSQRRLVMSGGRENSGAAVFRRLESKIVLVDLAGSERIGKSQSVGTRLREAQYINKSLAALGDVVATLSQSQCNGMAGGAMPPSSPSATGTTAHVPYRNNKLTALLQDALGGRSKTVLIACVAPNDPPFENHTAETLTTLQFASRVRCVRNVIQTPGTFPRFTPATPAPVGEQESTPVASSLQCSETDADSKGTRQWMRATESSKQRVNHTAEVSTLTGISPDDAKPAVANGNHHSHYYRAPMNQDLKPRMRF